MVHSVFALVAHIIYVLTVIGYGLYVCANAYTITVAGLQRLYKVFIFHLVLQISMALVGMVRPEDGIFIFSWSNTLLCHLLGRFYCFYCSFQPLLITVFSYYKTQVYTELATSSNVFLRRLRWMMKLALFVAFCDMLSIVGMCNSGPAFSDVGVRTCALVDTPVLILFSLGGFLFLVINGACILIFWKYRNLAEERREIENLEYQLRLNMYMFPLMHSSTIVIYGSQIYMQLIAPDNEQMITFWYHLIALDQLLNSYLMYLCLFGKGFGGFIPDLDWSVDDSSVCNHTVPAYGKTLDAEIWISFAGAHPMLVTEEVVNEMDLWDHVITNERRLKQIKLYRKRGHIASLFHCCITPQDFVFEMNNKRIPNSYGSDSENRAHTPHSEERDEDLSQAAASAVE